MEILNLMSWRESISCTYTKLSHYLLILIQDDRIHMPCLLLQKDDVAPMCRSLARIRSYSKRQRVPPPSLISIHTSEDLREFLQSPSMRLNEKEIDEDRNQGVPNDVEEVEFPLCVQSQHTKPPKAPIETHAHAQVQ